MEQSRFEQLKSIFENDSLNEHFNGESIEKLSEELWEEVERLRAALIYIGWYDERKCKHHEPSSVRFHLGEVARENIDCEVDYNQRLSK